MNADAFRRNNLILKWTASLIFVALVLIMMMFPLSILLSPRMTTALAIRLSVPWLPGLFYVAILWRLRGLFADLAAGGAQFSRRLIDALASVGWLLAAGAVMSLLVNPLLNLLLPPHRIGGLMIFDLPALALVMVGVTLVLLARMLTRAIAMQDELESFI